MLREVVQEEKKVNQQFIGKKFMADMSTIPVAGMSRQHQHQIDETGLLGG